MINTFRYRQILGLAALIGAVVFCWIAYGLYQPKILDKLGFVSLASWLGIFQGFLAAAIEPIIGIISDRFLVRIGSRLPAITFGVTLAGLIFILVASIVEAQFIDKIAWLIPILMTVWVVAMIIFRGPAVALLQQLAPRNELPQANSILLLIFGLVAASEPLINLLLNKIGVSISFILGAIVLLIGVYLLRETRPIKHRAEIDREKNDRASESPKQLLPRSSIYLLFLIGLCAGWEINSLLTIFSKLLQQPISNLAFTLGDSVFAIINVRIELVNSAILATSALSSLWLGKIITKIKIDRAMSIGLGAILGVEILSWLNHSALGAIVLIVAFGIVFAIVFVSMIPFILDRIPIERGGLATGLYFGGNALATAIVSLLLKQSEWTIATWLNANIIVFLIAIYAIVLLRSVRHSS
jgi:MFS family permease